MKTSVSYEFTHQDDEVVTGDFDHDDWKQLYGRKPDARRIYPDGSENWYYMTLVARRDAAGNLEEYR